MIIMISTIKSLRVFWTIKDIILNEQRMLKRVSSFFNLNGGNKMIDISPQNVCETHCHVRTLQKQWPRSNSTILETLEHPNLLWEIKGWIKKTQRREGFIRFSGRALLLFVSSHPSSSQGKKRLEETSPDPRSQEGKHQRVTWRVCCTFLEGNCSWPNEPVPRSNEGKLRIPVAGAQRWWLQPSICQGGACMSVSISRSGREMS